MNLKEGGNSDGQGFNLRSNAALREMMRLMRLRRALSGSKEAFVKLMNKTAENIGCENTQFKNPHGMKEKGHYTTAYDMMLITKAALFR